MSVRNGEQDSILFIREAQRADSGRYQLSVQLGGLEATATIDLLVIGTVGRAPDGVVLRGSLSRHHRELGNPGWLPHAECGTQKWMEGGVAEQRRRRGTPEAISTHASCTMPCAMLGPFREARPSSEYQVGGRLGLQCYPGVDTSPRHRQCGPPGIHGAEG